MSARAGLAAAPLRRGGGRGLPRAALALVIALVLPGCIVYSAASTAVSVTGTVLETGATIVGGAVDLVVPDDDD